MKELVGRRDKLSKQSSLLRDAVAEIREKEKKRGFDPLQQVVSQFQRDQIAMGQARTVDMITAAKAISVVR